MSRRPAAVLALAALVLAGCGAQQHPAPDPGDSTLRATLGDPDGDGVLQREPGEPLIDRGGSSRPVQTLATFAQITDAHVRDEESPARVPFLDRLGAPFGSTFRPQEALTLQVLDATVAAIDALHPDAVVQTGDLADNAQRNELTQAMTVLRGGIVDPDSGAPGPSGPQRSDDPDPFFYRPGVDAPRHPGLLAAAQRSFRARGLNAPLHSVLGNHDVLVAGELAPDARTQALATGSRAIVALDPATLRGLHVPSGGGDGGEGGLGSIGTARIEQILAQGSTEQVAPDPDRREVTHAEAERITGARAVEAFDIGPVRALALDLTRPEGGSDGRVSTAQLAWLRRQLDASGGRPVVVFTHQPLADSEGGAAALALLGAHRNVLAAIAGHTHRNAIRRGPGGVWEITTASLADYPEQARMFRVVRTADGGVALETFMVDHGPGPGGLAATSLDLSFLDAQGGRPGRFAGGRGDRNVRLHR